MVVSEEWWRGFEDCAEIVRDILETAEDLPAAKESVDRMLATVKERKLTRIQQELSLI